MRSREEHTAEITQVADIKILQKVNAAHREGFAVKYPGQIEHCLRLVMERLQLGLDKRNGVDPANPDTWRLSTQELSELVQCAYQLDSIRRGF